MDIWVSPDGQITKEVLRKGKFGHKPAEASHCRITISDSPMLLEHFNNTLIVIGDSDGDMWRLLDIGLTTMFVGEQSRFTLKLAGNIISLVVELISLEFHGFIFTWDAKKKYQIALGHKEKGNNFFKQKDNKEAAHRFTKALKILSSVPIDVELTPTKVDGISVSDINQLKSTLYNNLASCYFRNNLWEKVINLCIKVLSYEADNLKALYKIAVAYENDKDFEKARDAFVRVLELDPSNTASAEHLSVVKAEIKRAEIKCNDIMKRMFTAALQN